MMRTRAALAFSALIAAPALAHASPLIVDQQRVDQTDAQPAAQREELRGLTGESGASPPMAVPAQPTPTIAPSPTGEIGALNAVRISGSSLGSEHLRAAWAPYMGDPLDSDTITEISAEIAALYAASDIALYSVVTPEQDLSTGVLQIQVIEGHIANIVIQTDVADAPDVRLARTYAERLTEEAPLRRSTLERTMSLIRDISGERVEATLTPAAELGGAQLTLAMRRNRADVGFSISTRGTPLLGETQASADVSLHGMIRGGDRTDIAVTAPLDGDFFRYVALSHSTPIGDDGARLTANVSNMQTQPDGLAVEGEATSAGLSISYPIIRNYRRSLYASLGVDALDTENAVVGQVVDTNRTRAVRAGLTYTDSNPNRVFSASVFSSLGFDGMGARVDPLFAEADFNKLVLRGSWSRLYADHFALRLNGQLQTSPSLLPASEQMAIGGDAYGRAFASAIAQGDQGAAGSLEIAVLPPESTLPSPFRGSEAYVFYDAGRVRLHERPLLAESEDALSSAGLGGRIALGRRLTLTAELARGIELPDQETDDDWRLVYTLVGRN